MARDDGDKKGLTREMKLLLHGLLYTHTHTSILVHGR